MKLSFIGGIIVCIELTGNLLEFIIELSKVANDKLNINKSIVFLYCSNIWKI